MNTKIIVFNPLDPIDIERVESKLNDLVRDNWEIISSNTGSSAKDNRDYVVLILQRARLLPVIPRLQSSGQEHPTRSVGFICEF